MLKEEIIANKGYAVFHVGENDQIDEIAVRVLKQDCPDFLLPIKTISIDGKAEFRYELTDGIRMSYQQQKMSKREFVQLMVSMISPLKNCSDWMLDYHCFYLNPQYIFINAKDRTVHYIYLPVQNMKTSDKEVKDFLINFALSVELQDDRDFILKLLRLLRESHTNLFAVLEFLQNEIETVKSVGYSAKTSENLPDRNEGQKERTESEKQDAEVHNNIFDNFSASEKPARQAQKDTSSPNQFGKSNLEEELMKKFYGEENSEQKINKKRKKKEDEITNDKETKKGLFGGIIKKKKGDKKELKAGADGSQSRGGGIPSAEIVSDSAHLKKSDFKAVRNEPVLSDYTEIAGEEYEENDETVIRMRVENARGYAVPENIELDMKKGYVTVGRYDKSGYPCADFNFDHSLTFISRNHFRIEPREGGYTIIDLDSKNGTLLNGNELISNIPYDLCSGDAISISAKIRLTYRVL